MTFTHSLTPAVALALLALLVAAGLIVAVIAGVDPAMAGITLNALD